MSSVERINHYNHSLPGEESDERTKSYKPVPENWPSEGKIEASDLQVRYGQGPVVLKGLDFEIKGGETIGIVGRTGCGKSSLMVALFRIENPSAGSICIDGVDLQSVPLDKLRAKLGIIPQDPVVFSITVRFNLDPFDQYPDSALWEVLDKVAMKGTVLSFPLKLAEPVSEGGDNFSAGQRQLLCIARVLLRQPKVLVLDEATASVDNETDDLIQRMVRERFKDSTVLTIAHRLHTVIDADRIMLLNDGLIAEMDTPTKLLENKTGLFSELWKKHVDSRS
jgi:ABC-type multidrug transport system fused ATPase/permease subunit